MNYRLNFADMVKHSAMVIGIFGPRTRDYSPEEISA
jgi:hypothetical protein